MLAFSLLFFFVLLFSTTIAQPYKATDIFFLNCGSSATSDSNPDQKWNGDQHSKFVPSNINTNSFSSAPDHLDSSVPQIPYSTARIFNTSSFTYTFPVSQGPKFIRLHFYPATYSDLDTKQSFFSVSSNGYTLLTNFSAFLTLSFLRSKIPGTDARVVKEFLIYVQSSQILNVNFTPSHNSYAFINGIEIVSMPENLYFNNKAPKYVGQNTGPDIDKDAAIENIYRLNMGGGDIASKDDTGMYRSWDQDNNYIYGAAIGKTPVTNKSIMYTMETPNYTAPELVYQTQRSMGKLSDKYNLTWILPVDSGFYYMLRLHFCNIIPQYTKVGQVVFTIFINNQTAEKDFDLLFWTQGSDSPVFKDYIVFVNNQPDGRKTLVLMSIIVLIVFRQRRSVKQDGSTHSLLPSEHSLLPSGRCSRFSLGELKAATHEFDDNLIIGNGGFVLCARPVLITGLPKQEVNLAEWGKLSHKKGTLHNIIDPELRDVIAPECLRQFGVVAVSCLNDQGSDRPTMEKVVWDLEFALKLQEDAEKTVSGAVSENQEPLFPMQGDAISITDDDMFTESTLTRNGTSSISSTYEAFKSDTVFSEMLKPVGR
ncbi:hypothetical protein L1987_51255 [Smallanthus sonchifolius]|uniref:Uncharacterized protein n=1 Tax=Smallanthus sonchifolius TaxID=185202 RepID=A0ACB9EQ46_9ASTR|nr:hypothetical protein L1987_51255 [Smallanthus sonchifolius]